MEKQSSNPQQLIDVSNFKKGSYTDVVIKCLILSTSSARFLTTRHLPILHFRSYICINRYGILKLNWSYLYQVVIDETTITSVKFII